MSDSNDDRTLEERAADLKKQVGELQGETAQDTRESRGRGPIGNKWHKAMRYLGPIGWVIGQFVRWVKWVVVEPVDEDGDGSFSFLRTIRNLAISLAVLVCLHASFKALYFYTTYFEETVYVTGKQEVETGELYQFGGCTSLPCSTNSDNGKFYLIESSLYFPVMFYPEEDVFANIPQQNGACYVEGYGIYFRTLRWVYKSLQLYQHVVDVSCRPYTDEEIRRAVEGGQIVGDMENGPTD